MALGNFAAEVLADGPIGHWRLGEAPGTTNAGDASGQGNDGTYSGGITLGQPGFHGGDTAALFDGQEWTKSSFSTAFPSNQVNESNEGNNVANGSCLG